MIRGLIFDINGTLIDIFTNEESDDIFRVLSNFFIYQDIFLSAQEIHDLYFAINRRQRHDSAEEFPEFDITALFDEIIAKYSRTHTKKITKKKRTVLARTAAEIFRAVSLFQLQLYPEVKKVLKKLKKKYRMAAVSDGQSVWAQAELNAVNLSDFFDPLIVSGDFGYRKPDKRLFKKALKKMGLAADEVIFIGNDLYRDVYGANLIGMKSVFFKSNQGDHDFEKARPDETIYAFEELEGAIRRLARRTKKKCKK